MRRIAQLVPVVVTQRSLFVTSVPLLQQSSTSETPAATTATVSQQQVWGLWNEGNLFSLSVAQLENFLRSVNVNADPSKKKAALVRQVEEYLQTKDNQSKGLPPPAPLQPPRGGRGGGGGAGGWQPIQPVTQPETLLDLTQIGFYESPTARAPKAYQLMLATAAPDLVVSRVNTTAFPGFPANSECYTLASANGELSVRTRFAKAFQWCVMNLANLHFDGEVAVDFGKLLLHQNLIRRNKRVVSSYTLQQRLQIQQQTPTSTWVSTVSANSIAAVEGLLGDETFTPLGKPTLRYDVHIRRAKDTLHLEVNSKGQTTAVTNPWTNIQTSHILNPQGGIDTRVLLRSREPLKKKEVEHYSAIPVVQFDKEDVQDVLAPENGQVVFVSECEVRKWEKRKTLSGARFVITETKRQPLIVLRDEEDDPRVEYHLLVQIPANPTEKVDLRALSLEIYDVSKLMMEVLNEGFVKEYGCEPTPVTAFNQE